MIKSIIKWSVIGLLLVPTTVKANEEIELDLQEDVIEPDYHIVSTEWQSESLSRVDSFEQRVSPSAFIVEENNENIINQKYSEGYHSDVLAWGDDQSAVVEVDVPETGLYQLNIDYYPLSDPLVAIEAAITVNGEYQYRESRRISFPVDWKSEDDEVTLDRRDNQVVPRQVAIEKWYNTYALDANHYEEEPLEFLLEEGKNTIEINALRGELLLGDITLSTKDQSRSYEDYLEQYQGEEKVNDTVILEAELPAYKNSSYIRPIRTASPSVTPYETGVGYLNTFGGESWSDAGQEVTWKVEAPKSGLYQLSAKVMQSNPSGDTVFRTVSVNGEIPFDEMKHYPFELKDEWYVETLGKEEPFYIYLEQGNNEISMRVDVSPYAQVVRTIDQMMKEIEDLTLSIRQLTGNNQDPNRDWNIVEYIPEIEDTLIEWAKSLEDELDYLLALNNKEETTTVVSLRIAADRLRSLASEPNEIPNRIHELSEGSSSATQMLGTIMIDLQDQPLLLDQLYLHGETSDLPNATAGWFTKVSDSMKRFFNSFTNNDYSVSEVDDETLEVWVNRPRQYLELLQQMTDQYFTPETGIKVQYSLMPDEAKLILANAADSQPDIALGISNWLPYELAVRGAAVDLRQFEDFKEVGQNYSPGAFLPLVVDDGVYALPETQDFYVQYYRIDILESLDIPVPSTWDDVIDILPELQRFGMNYYTPIAGAQGFKPFQTTAPYIYQHGGDLYDSDGFGTQIDSEASLKGIQLMTDLNTIYSMPLQVPNFYNHFRYTTLPIGIAEFGTYVQLTAAAPEISGWWDIAPHPGVEQEDGTVERFATGSGQSMMMFEGSGKKHEAWELMKWWGATETQTEFAATLQTLYGPEYMWNTANVESFKQLPWPEEHKEVILEQWDYLLEVPKTPYSYMVEREISNVWNSVVFNGEITRSAVDDSIVNINRELRRKLEEFGYIEDGEKVKPYRIPTIELIEGWLEE
ncbi:ABC-type glycerol-3-phosphate transport system, substrate-binding protein [Halolactibacillus halophilus]|uniref:ABC transporter substrate-binding protein n=1 Tax=Halolactibacillus halophilus TaxID=306540 RepID=A0A1I5M683_9BACI|nr:extracellular solute-binding protein [Halolactibacillus halophilus]GEM01033.1 ABC transporter substrate-binding protein [Halolactibacillus halophilus]SFP05104.1 ABC-type glycerol-3-phosphate transport system, substrate-binding protein [Halolactibacillus halophilus]